MPQAMIPAQEKPSLLLEREKKFNKGFKLVTCCGCLVIFILLLILGGILIYNSWHNPRETKDFLSDNSSKYQQLTKLLADFKLSQENFTTADSSDQGKLSSDISLLLKQLSNITQQLLDSEKALNAKPQTAEQLAIALDNYYQQVDVYLQDSNSYLAIQQITIDSNIDLNSFFQNLGQKTISLKTSSEIDLLAKQCEDKAKDYGKYQLRMDQLTENKLNIDLAKLVNSNHTAQKNFLQKYAAAYKSLSQAIIQNNQSNFEMISNEFAVLNQEYNQANKVFSTNLATESGKVRKQLTAEQDNLGALKLIADAEIAKLQQLYP